MLLFNLKIEIQYTNPFIVLIKQCSLQSLISISGSISSWSRYANESAPFFSNSFHYSPLSFLAQIANLMGSVSSLSAREESSLHIVFHLMKQQLVVRSWGLWEKNSPGLMGKMPGFHFPSIFSMFLYLLQPACFLHYGSSAHTLNFVWIHVGRRSPAIFHFPFSMLVEPWVC